MSRSGVTPSAAAKTDDPLAPGDLIAGRYRIQRRLGAGGMGVVYAVRHTLTEKDMAIKVLLSIGDDAASQALKKRFLREARAACALHHPAMVPVHDLMEDGGQVLLVMDLLDGEPLEDLISREKKLSLEATARHLLPLASALGAIHAIGLVHRDVKSGNVFVTDDGSYLLDFGLVRDTRTGAQRLTMQGAVMGTPAYMSPEQAIGMETDHRTDLWSLGLLIYECLSGILPTEAATVAGTFEEIRRAQFAPLSSIVPGLPESVTSLVDGLLLSNPTKRIGSMQVVYDALTPFVPALWLMRYPRPPAPNSAANSLSASVLAPSDDDLKRMAQTAPLPTRELNVPHLKPRPTEIMPEAQRGSRPVQVSTDPITPGASGPSPLPSHARPVSAPRVLGPEDPTPLENAKSSIDGSVDSRVERKRGVQISTIVAIAGAALGVGLLVFTLISTSPASPGPATPSTEATASATVSAVPATASATPQGPVTSAPDASVPATSSAGPSAPTASSGAPSSPPPVAAPPKPWPRPTATATSPPPVATPAPTPKPTSTLKLPFP